MDDLYRLLNGLCYATEIKNPLSAMEEMSRIMRSYLEPAWQEYRSLENRIYELQLENDKLRGGE